MARFGLPLKVTELDFVSDGTPESDQAMADALENAMRMFFSYPNMRICPFIFPEDAD